VDCGTVNKYSLQYKNVLRYSFFKYTQILIVLVSHEILNIHIFVGFFFLDIFFDFLSEIDVQFCSVTVCGLHFLEFANIPFTRSMFIKLRVI